MRAALLLTSLLFGTIDGIPVSAPQPAPAANGRSQPTIAFSGDRYLAVWRDNRDCADYDSWTIYGARFDREGRILDPKGFVILPCGAMTGYGTPQVFGEVDGWSVTVPQQEALAVLRVSREGTVGGVRSVAIPVLFDPIVTRSERGWLIYNLLGDTPVVVTDPALNPLARLNISRFGVSVGVATDGTDYITVRSFVDRNTEHRTIRANVVDGDGTLKRSDVVIYSPDRAQIIPVSIVWTGSDYLVAWVEVDAPPANQRRLMTMRVSRDATVVEAPRELAGGRTIDTSGIGTLQLRSGATLVTWTTNEKAMGAIVGCDAPPFELPRFTSFATDGTSVLRIRVEPVMFGQFESRGTEFYSSIASIGCGALQWSPEQLASGATIAQELPSVAGDAIAWIEVQTNAIRGVRLNGSGEIAGELRFPATISPREVDLTTDGTRYFAAWNDGGVLKAGLIADAVTDEQPAVHRVDAISNYQRGGFEATWSGSEFLVFYVAVFGEIRVARFTPEGAPLPGDATRARHRVTRYNGTSQLVAPPRFAYSGTSVPQVAWSGSEGLLVWQIGFPCGLIPECFPPRVLMTRVDPHGRPLDEQRAVAGDELGADPHVIWTGTEYLVTFSGSTIRARRFTRSGAAVDTSSIDLGIVGSEVPMSLTMLGGRPLIVIAQEESIDGYLLDSLVRPERIAIADTSGSGRTFASAASRNGKAIVAFHRSIPGEVYGGSTRVFYKIVP